MGLIFAVLFVIFTFQILKSIDFYDYSYLYNDGKKELKIWLPIKMVQSVNRTLQISFGLSFLFSLIFLVRENWLLALISLMVSMIGIFYFRIRSKYKLNLNWSISTIENIDKNGFEIQVIKNGKTQSERKIFWEDIAKASLKKQELRLYIENGQKEFITPTTKHFYSLIRQLPKDFTNISYQQVNAHFKGLKPCLICGSVAANHYHCLACETPVWQKRFSKYYDNKRDYVKAKQLDLFASLQKNGQQAITFNRDETFDLHKNWQLLVSEEVVQQYSKKNLWIL